MPEIPCLLSGLYFLESSRKAHSASLQGTSESGRSMAGSAGAKGMLLRRDRLSGHVGEGLEDPAEIFGEAAHFLRQVLCSALHPQLLPFPLLGQPSTHSRNHRCNLFSLKLGAPFKVCPEKSQHFPSTKMKKEFPHNRTNTRLQRKKNHGISQKIKAYIFVMLLQGNLFIAPSPCVLLLQAAPTLCSKMLTATISKARGSIMITQDKSSRCKIVLSSLKEFS